MFREMRREGQPLPYEEVIEIPERNEKKCFVGHRGQRIQARR